ncbi:MAG TPA: RDD family protein, partial [Puia sp.]|nr:RDD family protein [Puia sp.]
MANKERPADISRRVSATLIDYTLVFALTIFFIIMAGTKDEEGTYTISGWPVFIPMLFWFLYFVIAEYYLEGT